MHKLNENVTALKAEGKPILKTVIVIIHSDSCFHINHNSSFL